MIWKRSLPFLEVLDVRPEKAAFILIAVLKRIKPCIFPLYKLSLPYQKLMLSEVIYNFRCL